MSSNHCVRDGNEDKPPCNGKATTSNFKESIHPSRDLASCVSDGGVDTLPLKSPEDAIYPGIKVASKDKDKAAAENPGDNACLLSELTLCIRAGDVNKLSRMLQVDGVNPDIKDCDSYKWAPLMWASCKDPSEERCKREPAGHFQLEQSDNGQQTWTSRDSEAFDSKWI